MASSLTQIIYVSSAEKLMSSEQLAQLLQQSRAFNSEQGICGLLLYADGNFMQVLEGEKAAVEELYQHICLDKRHRGMITLVQRAIEQTEFNDWAMGFMDVSQYGTAGFSDFLINNHCTLSVPQKGSVLNQAELLLRNFRSNMLARSV